MRYYKFTNMLNNLLISITPILILFSCSKKEPLSASNQNENIDVSTSNQLTNFKVSVIERSFRTTLIKWTPSTSSNALDTIRYKVVLNNFTIDSNLIRLTDSLKNILISANHTCSIIAYTKSGLSKTVNFNLEMMEGRSYGSVNLQNGIIVKNVFTNGVVNPYLWFQSLGDYSGSTPVLSNDTIFMTSGYAATSRVTAINKIDRTVLWVKQPTYSILNNTTITYYKGLLYAATDSGVICLNSANGSIIWRNATPYSFISDNFGTNPVIGNNKLFLATTNNSPYLVAFNLAQGTPLWQKNLSGSISKTPIAHDNKIIFNAGSTVYAIDQNTGSVLWQKVGLGRIFNSPILLGDKVFVINESGLVSALNVNTGDLLWSKSFYLIETGTNLAVGSGLFFLTISSDQGSGNYRSKILALDELSGNTVWEYNTLFPRATNLIYANNSIYFSGSGQYGGMLRINALSGNIEWGVLGTIANTENFSLNINNKVYYNSENGNYK